MTANLKEIRNVLYKKLASSGWDEKLGFFINSGEFTEILEKLYSEVKEGKRFSPPLRDVFKMFEMTHFKDVKVVFLDTEPYLNPTYNTGLALCHTQGERTVLEFTAMIDEVKKTVGNSGVIGGDLSLWASQGVLLLNTALTARVMLEGKHIELWRPFMNFVMEVLNQKEDLIWVSFGPNEFLYWINNPSHVKFEVPLLPAERKTAWDSGDVFNKINIELVHKNNLKISW